MIELKNIEKQYKKNLVLNNISIEFPTNGCVGIIGSNGSGKSVLLNTICGFSKPNKGEVKINGITYNSKKEYIQDAGIVINSPEFVGYLSIYDNLLEIAKILNREGTLEKVNYLLDYFDLEKDKLKKYRACSMGMKQKMRLIQAFMEEHPIYIIDEPTNALDKASIAKVRMMINGMKRNKLIIITSHNEYDIKEMADICYEISDGKLVEV